MRHRQQVREQARNHRSYQLRNRTLHQHPCLRRRCVCPQGRRRAAMRTLRFRRHLRYLRHYLQGRYVSRWRQCRLHRSYLRHTGLVWSDDKLCKYPAGGTGCDPAATTSECNTGLKCEDDGTGTNVCNPMAGQSCLTGGVCASGYTCDTGTCKSTCTGASAGDCIDQTNMVCETTCRLKQGADCTGNVDACQSGNECLNNICKSSTPSGTTDCTNTVCATEQICEGGTTCMLDAGAACPAVGFECKTDTECLGGTCKSSTAVPTPGGDCSTAVCGTDFTWVRSPVLGTCKSELQGTWTQNTDCRDDTIMTVLAPILALQLHLQ